MLLFFVGPRRSYRPLGQTLFLPAHAPATAITLLHQSSDGSYHVAYVPSPRLRLFALLAPSEGTPLETNDRQAVPLLLYLHTFASVAELGFAAYGAHLLHVDTRLCTAWSPRPMAAALVATTWAVIALNGWAIGRAGSGSRMITLPASIRVSYLVTDVRVIADLLQR